MDFQFKHIDPHPLLRGYLAKLWIFESSARAPCSDLKLIIPNDRIKLAVPFKNAIIVEIEKTIHVTNENSMTVTGIMDKAFNMDIASDGGSGTICAEFSPYGAHCFFSFPLSELRNRVLSVADLLPNSASNWEQRINSTNGVNEKAALFQQYLLEQFRENAVDRIFEFCVQKIQKSNGTIEMKELERATGYSGRWLRTKFKEKLGISPKEFASLVRFSHCYSLLSSDRKRLDDHAYYNYYYDQTHFIKDFKRYTGQTPRHIVQGRNEWGRLFYNA